MNFLKLKVDKYYFSFKVYIKDNKNRTCFASQRPFLLIYQGTQCLFNWDYNIWIL